MPRADIDARVREVSGLLELDELLKRKPPLDPSAIVPIAALDQYLTLDLLILANSLSVDRENSVGTVPDALDRIGPRAATVLIDRLSSPDFPALPKNDPALLGTALMLMRETASELHNRGVPMSRRLLIAAAVQLVLAQAASAALLTDPNDPRSWQGATVGTFAQLYFGANTATTRQQVIDNKLLDDGIFDPKGYVPAPMISNVNSTSAGTSLDARLGVRGP